MLKAAEAVITFNRDLLGTKPRPIAPMTSNEFNHLIKALDEEIHLELRSAWSQEDIVKMVDAKLDAIYFLIGGLYKCGLNAQQIHDCFMHVHDKNMEKKRGQVARRAVGDVPDAVKPEGFVPADVGIAAILGFTNEE